MIRSPIAAALFRKQLQEEREDWPNWRVDSAGTWALDGYKAASNALAVMESRGIDLSAHRAKTVTKEMLENYYLILVMEYGHKEALQVEFPRIAHRVFLLSEMEGKILQVDDPVGKALPAYEETALKIDQLLARGMQRIISLVEEQIAAETDSETLGEK